jgi:hypothetical protein
MPAIKLISSFTWGVDSLQITEGDGSTVPQVVSAVSTAKDRILVTFDREMLFHQTLSQVLKPSNYQVRDNIFSNKLYVARCQRQSDTEILLITQDQRAIPYTVTVKRAQDKFGTAIGGASNSAVFTGTDPSTHFPSVSKIYSFWGLYGGMQSTEQTELFPDIVPPYLVNQDPAPSETGVALTDHIIFDIKDDDTGVDAAYTVVWFDGAIIWQSGAPKLGWLGTATPVTNGFRYDLYKSGGVHLPEGKLCSIQVLMRDSATLHNATIESYTFSTASVAPYLQNQDPAPGDAGQDTAKDIYLEIVDEDSSIVLNSVVITVNGVPAWSSDAPQPGFTGIRVPVSDGYSYTINPDVDFPEGFSVTVGVSAADNAPAPGVLSTAYTYQTIVLQGLIYNHSFEIAGQEPGEADGWSALFDQAAEQIAPFEASLLPVDDFEAAWGGGNQLSHSAFDDNDVDAAGFNKSRALLVGGGAGVPWGSGIWGTSLWGAGGAVVSEGDYISLVEEFAWEWRAPRRHRECYVSNTGRPSPIYPDPRDAFVMGERYRDLTTGGTAYAYEKGTTYDWVRFQFVDWLNNRIPSGRGFCRDDNPGGSSGEGHVLAELHEGSHIIGSGTGLKKQFTATIPAPLLPLHPKIAGQASFLRIVVVIGGVTYQVTDDGAGKLVCTAAILGSALSNTVEYDTGVVDLLFLTAPDTNTKIWAFFEYGAIVATATADNASNLPRIFSTREMNEDPSEELPPYVHSSAEAFYAGNLEQAEIGGVKQAESFEMTWKAPNTGGAPYNEESQGFLLPSQVEWGVFYTALSPVTYEDFEEGWGWGLGNQRSQSTFDPLDLQLGIGETFEGTWDALPS